MNETGLGPEDLARIEQIKKLYAAWEAEHTLINMYHLETFMDIDDLPILLRRIAELEHQLREREEDLWMR